MNPIRSLTLGMFVIGCGLSDGQPRAGLEGYQEVVIPFLETYCLDCHDDASRKGKLSLEALEPDFHDGDKLEVWRLVREQVHFQDMPPQDKDQPRESERRAVLAWIRGELLHTQEPGAQSDEKTQLPQFGNHVDHRALFGQRRPFVQPGPPRLWRLRPAIYETVVPRLGERITGLANGLTEPDDLVLKDYAAPAFLDEAATAPLLGNAKKVAASLTGPLAKDAVLKRLADDSLSATAELRDAGVEAAFRRILNRLPTQVERERFGAFYEETRTLGGASSAARSLVTAVLMQPEALFRQELGDGTVDAHGRTRLAPRELAYALSYALDNRPREEFLRAAEEGALANASDVAEAVRAALPDDSNDHSRNPRILQFFREYFGYQHALEVFKDQPEGGQHEPDRLVGDLELTIIDILQGDHEVLAELLTTRDYYVNAKYGRKDQADQLVPRHEKRGMYHTAFNLPLDWKWSAERQPVRFREGERAGVLTHPAWLAAWSGNFDNHPVQRGKWIRTHLLGGSVPDVPIGVDARIPEAAHKTFRERLAMATQAAECWRCHNKMDPLGVAFERYDHYGRYQRRDAGQPVDASAAISRTEVPALHRTFAGPVEMMEFLARSEHVEQVFVRYVFRFFMGRNETLGDANTLQDAHRAYREGNGSFQALVVSLLSSDSFLLRQAAP